MCGQNPSFLLSETQSAKVGTFRGSQIGKKPPKLIIGEVTVIPIGKVREGFIADLRQETSARLGIQTVLPSREVFRKESEVEVRGTFIRKEVVPITSLGVKVSVILGFWSLLGVRNADFGITMLFQIATLAGAERVCVPEEGANIPIGFFDFVVIFLRKGTKIFVLNFAKIAIGIGSVLRIIGIL